MLIGLVAVATVITGWIFLPLGCAVTPRVAEPAFVRKGDEIVVCGQYFHTGAPVVLWTDPGGYDAYRVEKRFGPIDRAAWDAIAKEGREGGKGAKGTLPETPNRYGVRKSGLSEEELQRVRGGGWDLPLLQRTVDQFVLHYDVCGVSRRCFHVLHDQRGLSVHFMLDIDGTIYQSLDLKERAWHASAANDRSVGVEIANVGAVPASGDIGKTIVGRWYATDERGVRIVVPEDQGDGGVRTANFVGRPVRQEMVMGTVQGQSLRQYDLTPQQYASLVKLTAALCTIFPKIDCDYPKDASGQLITRTLDEESLKGFSGLLGHYHLTAEKLDPGPALQWEKLAGEARKLMRK